MLAVTDQATAKGSEILGSLAAAFSAADHCLYLVGGSIRGALLGRLGVDLDFITDARPETIRMTLDDWTDIVWDISIEFGALSAERRGHQMEITTFRAGTCDQVSRNSEVTFGDTLEGDLVRRGFRCNSIVVELHDDGTHTFLDPFGGFEDLVAGVLDTLRAPGISFGDDSLQMLHTCRFAPQLEFDVAPRVLKALKEMFNEIGRITVERISTEPNKLILGADPSRGIDLVVESGLADRVPPEIPDMRMTQDEHRQHKDVHQHSLQVMR